MTRNQMNKYLAVILTTVAAVSGGAPESPMYAALMGETTLAEFQFLLGLAADAGLVSRKGNVATITPKGVALVEKINAALAA